MRISVKSRYAIAAMITMIKEYDANTYATIISISEKLKISKIYLEQVFALLKRGELLISTKGSQGGYMLSRKASEISVYDILVSIESSLFEKAEKTVEKSAPEIEYVMEHVIFDVLDETVKKTLSDISLDKLVNEVELYNNKDNYMYYL